MKKSHRKKDVKIDVDIEDYGNKNFSKTLSKALIYSNARSESRHNYQINKSNHKKEESSIEENPLLDKAWQYYKNKSYIKAIQLYDQILKNFPQHKVAKQNKVMALNKHASNLLNSGDERGAKKFYDMALNLDDRNPFLEYSLGNYYHYISNPDFEEAESFYIKSKRHTLNYDGSNKLSLHQLENRIEDQLRLLPRHALKFYKKTKQYEKAAEWIEKLEKRAGNDVISLERLATLYLDIENFQNAEKVAGALEKHAGQDWNLLNKIVKIYLTIGNVEFAKRVLDKIEYVIHRDHKSEFIGELEYKSALKKLLGHKNYIDKKQKVLKLKYSLMTLEKDTNSSISWKELGELLSSFGQKEKALKCLDIALCINEDDGQTWYFRSVLLKNLGHLYLAMESCKTALKLDNLLEEAQLLLAELLTLSTDELSKVNDKLEVNTSPPFYLAYQANNLLITEKYNDAIIYYVRALDMSKKYTVQQAEWTFNKGICHLLIEDYESAVYLFENSVYRNNEKKSKVIMHKGIALMMQDKHLEALECFDKVIASLKQSFYFFNKGISLLFLNNMVDAFENFTLAYKYSPKDTLVLEIGKDEVKIFNNRLDYLLDNSQLLPWDYEAAENVFMNKRLYKTVSEMQKTAPGNIKQLKEILLSIPLKLIKAQFKFEESVFDDIIKGLRKLYPGNYDINHINLLDDEDYEDNNFPPYSDDKKSDEEKEFINGYSNLGGEIKENLPLDW